MFSEIQFINFYLMNYAFDGLFKKSLLNQSYKISPVFSSKAFIDLALKCRIIIHFELIFVYYVR